jgi:hypothetical protein
MNFIRSLILISENAFFALALFLVPLTEAQSKSEELNEKLPEISWPAERRPRMQGKYLQVEVDGPAEGRIKVTSGKITFVFEDEGRWALSSTTTPRYSIMMNDRLNRDLTFGIAQFSKGEFLASLDDEEWNPYVESIKNDVVPKKVVYEHYTAQGRSAPYIMKTWTRKIEYEYSLGNGKTGKTREIFSFIDGDLFVFIFSGNKSTIDANRENHNMFLTRMNLYTDT